MDSRKVNILEQSTRECSTESTLNTGPTAIVGSNIEPSAVHLDPPTDESPTENDNNDSTRLLGSSHAQYSSIGVQVPANGQSIDPEESERTADESSTNRCSAFLASYRNKVVNFRNSCYIHIIHVLFSYIPISAVIMGLHFAHECPQSSLLPIYETVVGGVGVVFMGFWIAVSCCERRGTSFCNLLKFVLGMLLAMLLLVVAIEMHLVGHLSPNFDPSAEDYCNKTFYYLVVVKERVTVAAIILAVLLYFPGSYLHTCCQHCAVPSPAGAFFGRL